MKQNLSIPSKVRAEHLNREALVYVRQSTMAQVRFNVARQINVPTYRISPAN